MNRTSVAIFARNLNHQLDLRDMTQADLCERLNLSKATVSSWCAGQKFPRIDKIDMLAAFFGITSADLMTNGSPQAPAPPVAEDVIRLPILGEVAAGYEHKAIEDWEGDSIEIPRSYLRGRPVTDFFMLRVKGSSMYPQYQDGDIVLVLRQATLNRSGDIGVILYDEEQATLKKVEFVMGEDWMRLVCINPNYEPRLIENEDLEKCRVLGIPRMVIREIQP